MFLGSPCGLAGKESACNAGDLGSEDPLEKGQATHSSILTWRITWTTYIVRGLTKIKYSLLSSEQLNLSSATVRNKLLIIDPRCFFHALSEEKRL